ncbi:hypothetical protein VN97_g12217 [Penicillium thymicola]|uniref:Uncharacterized protein n=1 Tax=Penicillium thymicola TaxID=293382 RepID=A0AAI9X2B9_PENTH|nr:hypothetical protein VN97_g12217 [Penicillium thymicola]
MQNSRLLGDKYASNFQFDLQHKGSYAALGASSCLIIGEARTTFLTLAGLTYGVEDYYSAFWPPIPNKRVVGQCLFQYRINALRGRLPYKLSTQSKRDTGLFRGSFGGFHKFYIDAEAPPTFSSRSSIVS